MEKITNWLTEKFQNPLSPLFFILGTLLVILGISNSINLPGQNQLIPDANFRWASLIIGCICLLIAILIYYRPPKTPLNSKKTLDASAPELRLSFAGRYAALTPNQKSILDILVRRGIERDFIHQNTLEIYFSQFSKTELFYRLEHLRLLGFIERQRVGQDNSGYDFFSYRLSSEYNEELGDLRPFGGTRRVGLPVTPPREPPRDKTN